MPHPWGNGLTELEANGIWQRSGESRLLPVQAVSEGLRTRNRPVARDGNGNHVKEKREQQEESSFAKSCPLIYCLII